MSCHISVVGRQLKNKKWDVLWEILDAGKEEGFIDYDILDAESLKPAQITNTITLSDAIIFVACAPSIKDKPFAHITVGSTEDEIIYMIQELADQVCGGSGESNCDDVPTASVVAGDSVDSDKDYICTITPTKLRGLVVEVNGKEITLTKDDADALKEMLEVMSSYGYTVKDVIVE